MNILYFILGLLAGLAWGTGCWFLIRKNRNRQNKTGMYVTTVLLFILCAGLFAGIQIGLPMTKDAIHGNMSTVDELMNDKLVRLLLSLTDTSALSLNGAELEAKLLSITENIAFWIYIIIVFILVLSLCIRIIQAVKKPKEPETQGKE